MRAPALLTTTALIGLAGIALPAQADAQAFSRVVTWPVFENLPDDVERTTETVAEIVAASEDGNTLYYTNSPRGTLGVVDITDPANPAGAGEIELGGEPTSVVVHGGMALVGVNTAESYTDPSGHLAVVDPASGEVLHRCDVGGQPDSLALSPDGSFVAVAVENERDEDLNDGVIPQEPAGHLAVLRLDGEGRPSDCDAATMIDLTGLGGTAPSDPEPEFVAINQANHAVVTMQENNTIAVVDLASGEVVNGFAAGAVDLENVDTAEDDVIDPSGALDQVKREPDAVAWLDDNRFVTADEGDYEGGSRGFTIFNAEGEVLYAAGNSVEHRAIQLGHYPEGRSENKGSEPEGVAVGTFGGAAHIFVGLERANLILVYADQPEGEPQYVQALPTGVGPEGILPIASRDLLVVAAEADSADDGFRSNIAIYEFGGAAAYPQIVSDEGADDLPIGWGALSALAADPEDAATLYSVHDSFYAEPRIYTIDASEQPARITGETVLTKPDGAQNYDLEGIAVAADGGFWLASEANRDGTMRNLLIKTDAEGTVTEEIMLPEEIDAKQVRHGYEGVAASGEAGDETVVVAFQRALADEPAEQVRLGLYSTADQAWAFVAYPLDKVESQAGGWVGLSEITALGEGRYAIVERDNQSGPNAAIKRVYSVDLAAVEPVDAGAEPPLVEKTLVADILPMMQESAGYTPDKLEGFTVAADGTVYAVTDNDGIDDATGETQFFSLGQADQVFAQQ